MGNQPGPPPSAMFADPTATCVWCTTKKQTNNRHQDAALRCTRTATSSTAGAAGRGSGPTSRTPCTRRRTRTEEGPRSFVRAVEGERDDTRSPRPCSLAACLLATNFLLYIFLRASGRLLFGKNPFVRAVEGCAR